MTPLLHVWLSVSLLCTFQSCKSHDNEQPRDRLIEKYCALGASTASQSWQTNVGYYLANDFRSYAVSGVRWTVNEDVQIDFSGNSKHTSNNVMHNQLLRLLKDKHKNSYSPDLITILCGLNDYYYPNDLSIFGFKDEAFDIDMHKYTAERWLTPPKIHKNQHTFMFSLCFVLQRLQSEFPNAKIVIMTVQYTFTHRKEFVDLLNENIINIANIFGIDVIDICKNSQIPLDPHYYKDNLHLNTYGEDLLYQFMVKELHKIIKR